MAWFRSGFQLLPQMQHSAWRLGTLPGSVLPCQQLIGRMRHSMGWFGTLLATCGCVGSYSLKCSIICCSWGCSIRLHAAVQLLYLMLTATRSDAAPYVAALYCIWFSRLLHLLSPTQMHQFTLRLGCSIRPCAAVSAQLLAQMQHCVLRLGLITGEFTLPCLRLLTQTQHSMWLLGFL